MRKMYNDAGVNIHIHKMGFGQSNEEIEFNFLVAKALGCTAVTTERNAVLAARVAPFADKHKIWVGFHNHTNNLPEMDKFDSILDLGQYIGFNLDIGHYVAGIEGQVTDPRAGEVSRAHHEPAPEGPHRRRRQRAWGQGQTPIKEVLQLMKKEKWTFPAEIELEYKNPRRLRRREGSGQVRAVLQRGAGVSGLRAPLRPISVAPKEQNRPSSPLWPDFHECRPSRC
jgi:sugar phosphate isomerase/epimerase